MGLLVSIGKTKNTSPQNQYELLIKISLFFCLLFTTNIHAEGTKTWQPDISSRSDLYISSESARSFAHYSSPSNVKMYIHIEDTSNEMVYLGFSGSNYQFRIISPTGAIVHGPYTVTSPNANSHALATAGPNILNAGGYSTANAMFKFDPTGLPSGDYSIEFASNVDMRWFDVTVTTKDATPLEIKGRLWSQAWQVNCGSLAAKFKAMFYARDESGYVTQVNFSESGLRPYAGQFSFNDTGTGTSGNVVEDRKSVPNASSVNPVQKVFLNPPDPNIYPLGVSGEVQNLPLKIEDPANPNITIDVTQAGRVEIVLDFGVIGNYQEAIDKRLFANLTAGVNTIPWDGTRGDGQQVQPHDYPIPITISYTQGETHFTAYDVEYLNESFVVRTQTSTGLTTPNILFWDDSRITYTPGLPPNQKVNTDIGSIARQPWSTRRYGDYNTINTWWFAYRDYETSTILMPGDYSDAPRSYGGAVHEIQTTPTVYLGAIAPDKEPQIPTLLDGTGDDADNIDDEDAFTTTLPELFIDDTNYSLSIACKGEGANISAWVDFNNSGTFDLNEKTTSTCTSGASTLSWATLTGISVGSSYVRLRIASNATDIENPSTGASDGEVEDYPLEIKKRSYDYGDAPNNLSSIDASLTNAYPTLLANNGARHVLGGAIYLGSNIDPDSNGQANLNATGDDTDGTNDDDGVSFPTSGSLNILRVGKLNNISITASSSGFLNAWIDWNQDGDWDDAGEQIATDLTLAAGANTLSVTPSTLSPQGKTYARFRFSSIAGLLTTGLATDGEVEDYAVNLTLAAPLNACSPSLLNNGFEALPAGFTIQAEDNIVGWSTQAVNPASGASYTERNSIEIWNSGFNGVPAYQGNQFAELNAHVSGILYQDIELPVGTTFGWRFAHRAHAGTNTIKVLIGPPHAPLLQGQFSSGSNQWNVFSGTYTVPAGQTITRFAFQSDDAGSVGNFIDAVQLPGGCDFGDAPDSYRTKLSSNGAHHIGNSQLYMGAEFADSEVAAFGGDDIDNTGTANDDDTEGNRPDDEDGVASFNEINDLDTHYSVKVTVKNTTGSAANMVGWIDFDLNGIFDSDEAATITIPHNSNGIMTLNWNNIPTDIKAGNSFIRLRISTDNTILTGNATTSLPSGRAKEGEVEDYPLLIKVGGFPVKGRAYKDTHLNGINDGGAEEGISGLPIVLVKVETNPANNTCVSVKTRADGHYTFFPVIPGTYQLYEASRETVTIPQHCHITKAKDPAGYRSTTANFLAEFNVSNAEITGKDFGDIKDPTFTPHNSGTILAGSVVFYTHKFTPPSTGTVVFTSVNTTPITAGWSNIIYQDLNCNGILDTTEANTPVTSLATTANTDICLINKVYAPSSVNNGETYANTITAIFNFNGNIIAGNKTLKVTDLTKAAADDLQLGHSKLELRKTVQNMTQNTAETATLNQAKPAETLKYRIYYSNTGNGPLTDLEIKDTVPEFTTVIGLPICDLPLPNSLTNCTPSISNDAIKWTFPPSDVLKGGASGVVSYEVKID